MRYERIRTSLTCLPCWQFLCLLFVGCATTSLPLNSERIAARYGSYSIAVLQQDERMRVSSLASQHGERLVTRTLAVTLFAPPNAALVEVSARIRAGASIGSSFHDAGWQVSKETRYIGSYALSEERSHLAELMAITAPIPLAMHAYCLLVSRDGRTIPFATIIELHHPDYLRQANLRRIYGSSSALTDAEEALLRTSVAAALAAVPVTAAP